MTFVVQKAYRSTFVATEITGYESSQDDTAYAKTCLVTIFPWRAKATHSKSANHVLKGFDKASQKFDRLHCIDAVGNLNILIQILSMSSSCKENGLRALRSGFVRTSSCRSNEDRG